MKIERRFTTSGQSPYASIEFRTTKSEIRNPDGSVVFSLDNIEVPASLEPGRRRRAGAEIFPQGRRAGALKARRGKRGPLLPVALGRRHGGARRSADRTSARPAKSRPSRCSTGSPAPGPIGAGRAAISTRRKTPRPFSDELRYMLARQMAAPNSPQWFNTGLHWAYGVDGPGQGHFYVDYANGKLVEIQERLRASAAARLLHPVGRGRSRQRRRHHGPLGARGAAVQIWLGHRLQLLEAARREGKALGRRLLLGADVLPQDRRPRGGRDQIRRHDAPRRQDGRRRRRSSRHRGLRRMEGQGGGKGRRAGRRLENRQETPQGDLARLRELRGRRTTIASTRK